MPKTTISKKPKPPHEPEQVTYPTKTPLRKFSEKITDDLIPIGYVKGTCIPRQQIMGNSKLSEEEKQAMSIAMKQKLRPKVSPAWYHTQGLTYSKGPN